MKKSLSNRIIREKDHHHKMDLRSKGLKLNPDKFFDPIHHYYRTVFNKIGDLNGKIILDLGCGEGHWSIMLALKYPKARIFSIDVAENLIKFAKKRAEYNKVAKRVNFEVMPAEFLNYPDNSFDIVFGMAIIHHVDIKQASNELNRVIKSGGKAIFAEPLGENPLLEFTRRYVPYSRKNRSPDENPLKYPEIKRFTKQFSNVRLEECEFLASITRVFRNQVLSNTLNKLDSYLFTILPGVKRLSRYIIIEFESN